jgi:hypothetical protein
LIGFYGVFQGVIVSAVAQAINPASPASWGPASLSVLASIATLLIVHIKLNDYKMLSMDAEKELADAKVRLQYIHHTNVKKRHITSYMLEMMSSAL